MRINLSDREKEVLELIAKGYNNRKIGELLFITTKSVEHHINGMLNKVRDSYDITDMHQRTVLVNLYNNQEPSEPFIRSLIC